MPTKDEALERLLTDVLASAKYRDISPDLVKRIGAQELSIRRNLKEAIKATRSKLHQIGGAYIVRREDYSMWSEELRQATQLGSLDEIRGVCRSIMKYHASTRERLPLLDQFYSTILADLPPVQSVLDLACGLHPLAIPWMPLAAGARYYTYDIYQHMTDFLNDVMSQMPVEGKAQVCDIIQTCPDREVDLAFLLKAIPCLEQVDKQAGYRLLRAIHAKWLVVSFPIHSLGGRRKGMEQYYEAHFHELVGAERWEVKRFTFATELVFVVKK